MKNIVTLIGTVCVMLFMSACSNIPQSNSSQRSKAYAYRTPKPQAPKYTPQQKVQPVRVANKQKAPSILVASQQTPQQSNVPQIHPARNQMMGLLQTTLGTPYKWGGNNPQQGFDCSGLMAYVHKNALGIKIPRTAATQRDSSRTLNYSNIQPGDMLFFKTSARSNHVGMYIGNRKFIHAPAGGKKVTVASMDSSYWHKRFVKFGTYLN